MSRPSPWAHMTGWQIDLCGLVVLAGISVAAWTLGLAPWYSEQKESAARREQVHRQSQQVKQVAAQVRQETRQLEDARAALSQIQLNLQPAGRINQRLAEVTATAVQCGLEVSDVRPGRPLVARRHTIVPLEVSGTGSFPAAVRFFREFHRTFADSGVATFELAADPTRPGSPASFHFCVHWYVEPQAASAGY